MRGEKQIVHVAEFHLARVLVEPREKLREKCGDDFALHVRGHRVRHEQALLQGDDRAGYARQLREIRDDLRGRPFDLFGLAEKFADCLHRFWQRRGCAFGRGFNRGGFDDCGRFDDRGRLERGRGHRRGGAACVVEERGNVDVERGKL